MFHFVKLIASKFRFNSDFLSDLSFYAVEKSLCLGLSGYKIILVNSNNNSSK